MTEKQSYLYSSPEGVIKLIEGDKMPAEPEYGICSEEPRPDCFNKEDCRCGLQWKPYRNALQHAKKQAVTVQNREVAHAVIVRDGHHLDKFGEPKNDFIYGPFSLRYEVKSVLVLEKNTPGVSRIRHYEKRAILYDDTPEKEDDLKEKIEFIKGAFQCYVGFPGTEGLLRFLKESKFTITRKQ